MQQGLAFLEGGFVTDKAGLNIFYLMREHGPSYQLGATGVRAWSTLPEAKESPRADSRHTRGLWRTRPLSRRSF